MSPQAELRAFAYGAAFGTGAWFAVLLSISAIAGIRWQPVKVGATDAELATKPYPAIACSNYPVSGIVLPACPK